MSMDWMELATKLSEGRPWLARLLESAVKTSPAFQGMLEEEFSGVMEAMEASVKPYSGEFVRFTELPPEGHPREQILAWIGEMKDQEEARWKQGFASGAVYHGDSDHVDFVNQAYALESQANPLHADLWPSITKFESEIVAMTAHMLGADPELGAEEGGVCGAVTSGGTESILLAMKTYRDWARAERGIRRPEMVLPVTAHAAFDKAAEYFKIKTVKIPVDEAFRADVEAARRAIGRRTAVVVGSAPSFPHGAIDPIAELSSLAREKGVGFHVDACLGGFLLPWAEELGYPVPAFDFRLPGVTSMSADTHKFGYAAKGTSVVLYRGSQLRRYQYFTATEWPGGLYLSPTFAGSRPGGLSAACWAAMVSIGENGYREAARRILETATRIRKGVEGIPALRILGNPLFVIAFDSPEVDIYLVLDEMTARGWSLNGLHNPPCVHLCVTLRQTRPGVAERFVEDLRESVEKAREGPRSEGGMAPIYGMAATLPFRGLVDEILRRYLDLLYKT
jgi:glutamate/tyrosine decarboxylase-like PLP-dependent enzyme